MTRRRSTHLAARVALAAVLALSGWDVAAFQQKPPPKPAGRTAGTERDARPLRGAREDPSHPGNDPNHPLKDPMKDPGPDPGQVPEEQRKSDGTPAIQYAAGDWPWGELLYGKTYPTKLTIKNECWSDETVGIFVTNLPYISLPGSVTVPARSSKDVPIDIITPPPPNLILTGRETIPEHGIFGEVEGEIVVWHPWRFDPSCSPNRETYKARGHIHYDLTPPPPPPSPERIAGAGPCQVWWNTGQRPPQVKDDRECLEPIRQLASDYRSRVLQTHVDRSPAAWAWLPVVDQIGTMEIGALIAMKHRAHEQINGGSAR